MTASFLMPTNSIIQPDFPASERNAALRLYERTRGGGWRIGIRSRLRRQPSHLLTLDRIPSPSHDGGLHTVSIRQIRGSENGGLDFDADFHPLRRRTHERWLSIATARLYGATRPPIELIQIGDSFCVRDGHHRISVARALGEEFIEAHIISPS